jgi:hypothetical protein
MNRSLASLLVLVSALFGLFHGARTAERELAAARAAPPGVGKADRASGDASRPRAGGAADSPAGKPPAVPAPAADLAGEARAKARGALSEGDRARARGAFREAAASYREAARAVAGADDVESIAIRNFAAKQAARAKVLAALKDRVAPNDFADGKDLFKIEYARHEYVVRIVSKDEKTATLRLSSGVEFSLPTAEIERIEPCPPEEWRRRVEKGLAERKEKADEQSPLELYQIAYYCLEHGLASEATPWLEKALERDRDGILIETFCLGADRLGAEEIALVTGRRPETGAEPAPAEDGASAPAPLGAAPAAAASAIFSDPRWREVGRKLDRGRDHYRLSYGSGKRADEELAAATKIFDEAFELIRALAAAFPDSEEVARRLTEITLIRADCHKRTKVAR